VTGVKKLTRGGRGGGGVAEQPRNCLPQGSWWAGLSGTTSSTKPAIFWLHAVHVVEEATRYHRYGRRRAARARTAGRYGCCPIAQGVGG